MRTLLLAATALSIAASPVLAQSQLPVVKDSTGRNVQASGVLPVDLTGTYVAPASSANQTAQTTAINSMSATQGAAAVGQTEQLVACSVTTAPPTYTTGTTNPFNCAPDGSQRVRITPSSLSDAAIVPSVSASAAATSLILKASAGNYYDGYCKSSVVGNCIAYNSTTVPSAGALTASLVLECAPILTAGGVASWSYGNLPRRASVGIVYLFSSSTDCNTYTASATAYIHGSVQ